MHRQLICPSRSCMHGPRHEKLLVRKDAISARGLQSGHSARRIVSPVSLRDRPEWWTAVILRSQACFMKHEWRLAASGPGPSSWPPINCAMDLALAAVSGSGGRRRKPHRPCILIAYRRIHAVVVPDALRLCPSVVQTAAPRCRPLCGTGYTVQIHAAIPRVGSALLSSRWAHERLMRRNASRCDYDARHLNLFVCGSQVQTTTCRRS